MRVNEHDLNSLRYIIRQLQEENEYLKSILDEKEIEYETDTVIDAEIIPHIKSIRIFFFMKIILLKFLKYMYISFSWHFRV